MAVNLLRWAGHKAVDWGGPGLPDPPGEGKSVWNELLHPRGPDGRFIKKWGMGLKAAKRIFDVLRGAKPREFRDNKEAATWAKAEHASMPDGNWSTDKYIREFSVADANLSAGNDKGPQASSFIQMMDSKKKPLDQDAIITVPMTPEMLGLGPDFLTPKPHPEVAQPGEQPPTFSDVENLTGQVLHKGGYAEGGVGDILQTPGNPIKMVVLAPRGTPAIFPGMDKAVDFDRNQGFQVTKVEPDGRGGAIVYAVATSETPTRGGVQMAPRGVRQGETKAETVARVESQAQARATQQAQETASPLPVHARPSVPQPGFQQPQPGPGARTDGIVAPAVGGPGAPAAGAPEAAPVRSPQTFRGVAMRSGLQVPSEGRQRNQWNRAFQQATKANGDPELGLRTLERDINDNKADLARDPSNDRLKNDIADQEKLADLIAEHFDFQRNQTTAAPQTPGAPTQAPTPAVQAEPSRALRNLDLEVGRATPTNKSPGTVQQTREARQALGAENITRLQQAREQGKAAEAAKKAAKKTSGQETMRSLGPEYRGTVDTIARARANGDDLKAAREAEAAASRLNGGSEEDNRAARIFTKLAADIRSGRAAKPVSDMQRARKELADNQDAFAKLTPQRQARWLLENNIPESMWPSAFRNKDEEVDQPRLSAVREAADALRAKGVGPKPAKGEESKAAPGTPEARIAQEQADFHKLGEAGQRQYRIARREGIMIDGRREKLGHDKAMQAAQDADERARQREAQVPTKVAKKAAPSLDQEAGRALLDAVQARGDEDARKYLMRQSKDKLENAASVQDFFLSRERGDQKLTKAELVDRIMAAKGEIGTLPERPKATKEAKKAAPAKVVPEKPPTPSEEVPAKKRPSTRNAPFNPETAPAKPGAHTRARVIEEPGVQAPGAQVTQEPGALTEKTPMAELRTVARNEGVPGLTTLRTKAALRDAIQTHRENRDKTPEIPKDAARPNEPMNAPRASDFTEAWGKQRFHIKDAETRDSMAKMHADLAEGRITPEEAVRRIEGNIATNNERIGEIDAHLRNIEITEVDKLGMRRDLARLENDQKVLRRASTWTRKYFHNEPVITKSEMPEASSAAKKQVEALVPEGQRKPFLEAFQRDSKADRDSIREAARAEGLGELDGTTTEELFQDSVRKVIQRELKSRGTKKAAPKKVQAPEQAPGAARKVPQVRDIAGGLGLKIDEKHLDEIQKMLDDPKMTPGAVASKIESWRGGLADPRTPAAYERATLGLNGGTPTAEEISRAEARVHQANEDWNNLQELANALKKQRRSRMTAPRPKPAELTPEEKSDVAKAADLAGVPEATVTKRALDRKEAATPVDEWSRGQADLVKAATSEQQVDDLMKGKTAAEVKKIAETVTGKKVRTRTDAVQAMKDRVRVQPLTDTERDDVRGLSPSSQSIYWGFRSAGDSHTSALAKANERATPKVSALTLPQRTPGGAGATSEATTRANEFERVRGDTRALESDLAVSGVNRIKNDYARGVIDKPQAVRQLRSLSSELGLHDETMGDHETVAGIADEFQRASLTDVLDLKTLPDPKARTEALRKLDTREQADAALEPMSGTELRAIAKEMNIPSAVRMLDKEKVRRAIVDGAVGMRLQSIARRGFTGRPDQPGESAQEFFARTRREAGLEGANPHTSTTPTSDIRRELTDMARSSTSESDERTVRDFLEGQTKAQILQFGKDIDAAGMSPSMTKTKLIDEATFKMRRGRTSEAITKREPGAALREAMKPKAPAIDENVALHGSPEGDNMRMHGDSLTMGLAQEYAKAGRNGSANQVMEIRRRATAPLANGGVTPQEVVDRLKALRASETDPAFQRRIDRAIAGIDAPMTPLPAIPANTPPILRKLLEDVHAIPYARKKDGDPIGAGSFHGPSLEEQVAQAIRDAAAGTRGESGRPGEERVHKILRDKTHEINEASFRLWDLGNNAHEDRQIRAAFRQLERSATQAPQATFPEKPSTSGTIPNPEAIPTGLRMRVGTRLASGPEAVIGQQTLNKLDSALRRGDRAEVEQLLAQLQPYLDRANLPADLRKELMDFISGKLG